MTHHRGFTLVESLIAVLIAALCALALMRMQTTLTRGGESARQRTEALRHAEEAMEAMRSAATAPAPDGTPSAWVAAQALEGQATVEGDTTAYAVTRQWRGDANQPLRVAEVAVSWADASPLSAPLATDPRQTATRPDPAPERLTLRTVVAAQSPRLTALLAQPPAPGGDTLRPARRSAALPRNALPLGGGLSAVPLAADFIAVAADATGALLEVCSAAAAPTTSEDVQALRRAGACRAQRGLVVSGHIGRTHADLPWPRAIDTSGVTRQQTTASAPIRCTLGDVPGAAGDTLGATGSRYYVCVIPLEAPHAWSGTLRLAGLPVAPDVVVCRVQYEAPAAAFAANDAASLSPNDRHVQPYVQVQRSLHSQHYVVARSADGTCPSAMTMSGVATGALHQDCRSNDPVMRPPQCPA